MIQKRKNKPNFGVTLPLHIGREALPILLSAYKYGIYYMGFLKSSDILSRIARSEFIEYKNISGFYFVLLTEKGANFVEQNAIKILASFSPYYTYPLIQSGDRVKVDERLSQVGGYKHFSVVVFPEGTYNVVAVDRHSMLLIDATGHIKRFKFLQDGAKGSLHFITDNLNDFDVEFKKRFPPINVKRLVKVMGRSIHSLSQAEIMNKIYEKSYITKRLEK